MLIFQLTTSQGGRRPGCCHCSGVTGISTHDLARRSTPSGFPQLVPTLFQLTTSQGGRRYLSGLPWPTLHFNSRPRKEVDDEVEESKNAIMSISTHDLARRSTVALKCQHHNALYFNSRPRKEVDTTTILYFETLSISTHDLARRSTP